MALYAAVVVVFLLAVGWLYKNYGKVRPKASQLEKQVVTASLILGFILISSVVYYLLSQIPY